MRRLAGFRAAIPGVVTALLSIACASRPLGTPRTENLAVEDRDILLILDVSRSTIDPWRDSLDLQKPSSFLMQEVQGAREFLAAVDHEGAAVGIIAFSGEPSGSQWRNPLGEASPAWTEVPLTSDFADLDRALNELKHRVPEGSTHLAAAIDQGTIELYALRGARSKPRLGAFPAMIVFADGLPTLPYGPRYEKDNVRAARRALARARRAGIECHLLALGPDASKIASLEDNVEETGGTFTLVEDPHQLESEIQRLAKSLSPARPLPAVAAGPEPLAMLEGTWGWPPSGGVEGFGCTENPHTIEVSEDRQVVVVRYEHPVEREGGERSSELRYRVMEQRKNFVRIEKENAPGSDPILRVMGDSYCWSWSSTCAQRCR